MGDSNIRGIKCLAHSRSSLYFESSSRRDVYELKYEYDINIFEHFIPVSINNENIDRSIESIYDMKRKPFNIKHHKHVSGNYRNCNRSNDHYVSDKELYSKTSFLPFKRIYDSIYSTLDGVI